jgi:hypothetical protein
MTDKIKKNNGAVIPVVKELENGIYCEDKGYLFSVRMKSFDRSKSKSISFLVCL